MSLARSRFNRSNLYMKKYGIWAAQIFSGDLSLPVGPCFYEAWHHGVCYKVIPLKHFRTGSFEVMSQFLRPGDGFSGSPNGDFVKTFKTTGVDRYFLMRRGPTGEKKRKSFHDGVFSRWEI